MSRDVSDGFLSAAAGSNRPVCYADVWYDSDIIREGAFIVGGKVDWEASNAVEDRLSLVLVDRDSRGSRLSDIIHSYGCRINLRAGFDIAGTPELVSLGWFDIVETDAVEEWRWFDWTADANKISEVVTIQSEGLMSLVTKSGLFAPTQPTPGSDAWAAAQDLCLDVVSVLDPGYTAKLLPSGNSAIVFDKDRMKAIQDIAQLWGAKPVITDEGQMTFTIPGAGPVVADFGLDINVEAWRNQTSSDGLTNGVDFAGRTAEGVDLHGYATEDSGPLFWGGPLGRRPSYAASSLMSTQAEVDAAAATELERIKRDRSATQTVKALWNPALMLRDRPTLVLPDREVDSEITRISMPLPGGQMDVTLRLPLYLEV